MLLSGLLYNHCLNADIRLTSQEFVLSILRDIVVFIASVKLNERNKIASNSLICNCIVRSACIQYVMC